MSDNPEPEVKSKPVLTKALPKPPLHPALKLEEWISHVDLTDVAERLAAELQARGLNTPEALKRAPNAVVAALQRVLHIDAAKLLNDYLKEEK